LLPEGLDRGGVQYEDDEDINSDEHITPLSPTPLAAGRCLY